MKENQQEENKSRKKRSQLTRKNKKHARKTGLATKACLVERVDNIIQKKNDRIRDLKLEQLKRRERENRDNCTFKPKINKKSKKSRRTIKDLYEWNKKKKERRFESMRLEHSEEPPKTKTRRKKGGNQTERRVRKGSMAGERVEDRLMNYEKIRNKKLDKLKKESMAGLFRPKLRSQQGAPGASVERGGAGGGPGGCSGRSRSTKRILKKIIHDGGAERDGGERKGKFGLKRAGTTQTLALRRTGKGRGARSKDKSIFGKNGHVTADDILGRNKPSEEKQVVRRCSVRVQGAGNSLGGSFHQKLESIHQKFDIKRKSKTGRFEGLGDSEDDNEGLWGTGRGIVDTGLCRNHGFSRTKAEFEDLSENEEESSQEPSSESPSEENGEEDVSNIFDHRLVSEESSESSDDYNFEDEEVFEVKLSQLHNQVENHSIGSSKPGSAILTASKRVKTHRTTQKVEKLGEVGHPKTAPKRGIQVERGPAARSSFKRNRSNTHLHPSVVDNVCRRRQSEIPKMCSKDPLEDDFYTLTGSNQPKNELFDLTNRKLSLKNPQKRPKQRRVESTIQTSQGLKKQFGGHQQEAKTLQRSRSKKKGLARRSMTKSGSKRVFSRTDLTSQHKDNCEFTQIEKLARDPQGSIPSDFNVLLDFQDNQEELKLYRPESEEGGYQFNYISQNLYSSAKKRGKLARNGSKSSLKHRTTDFSNSGKSGNIGRVSCSKRNLMASYASGYQRRGSISKSKENMKRKGGSRYNIIKKALGGVGAGKGKNGAKRRQRDPKDHDETVEIYCGEVKQTLNTKPQKLDLGRPELPKNASDSFDFDQVELKPKESPHLAQKNYSRKGKVKRVLGMDLADCDLSEDTTAKESVSEASHNLTLLSDLENLRNQLIQKNPKKRRKKRKRKAKKPSK